MSLLVRLGFAFAGVCAAVGCGDLFHDTDWESKCRASPGAFGCPDVTSAAQGGGGPGGEGGSGPGGAGGAGPGGAGGAGGGQGGTAGGGGGVVSPECEAYCTLMNTMACLGANAMYVDQASCVGYCAKLPPGNDGAMTGNSFACREYHAGAAALDDQSATVHCVHAGPGGAGLCGTNCESFCSVATQVCPGEYATVDECAASCAAFDDSLKYNAVVTTGNTLACRLRWLTVAAQGAQEAAIQCPKSGVASPTCL